MQFQSKSLCIFFAGALLLVGVNSGAFGEEDSSDLAKKLSNPVANLISVPLQNNVDWGRNDEFHYQINFQPVVPFTLSQDWDVIVRTIVPFVTQSDVLPGSSQIGLGDTTQSFFFVPTKIGGGWILGVGPDLLYPTATDHALGSGKFGLGPTVVALRQEGPWTYGILYNHLWSVAGSGSRPGVSSSFFQPFLAYVTPSATTFTVNTESTYDWEQRQWTVPINLMVSQVVKFGSQPISFGIGARYTPEAPINAPQWGFRFVVTYLFPKK